MTEVTLFGDMGVPVPKTEGIKYAGSKLRLIPHILRLARQTGSISVLDGFSGTTRVSQAFAKSGYNVICNDTSAWSKVFGICYLLSEHSQEHYEPLIDDLNKAQPTDGWYTHHYGGVSYEGSAVQQDGLKRPWQRHNTKKLDGIRERIETLSLAPIEKAVALTSLILALDKVDNTIGHYCAYLKKWSSRSYDEMNLSVPLLVPYTKDHQVLKNDIFDILDKRVDLAYLDPPYGSNNDKMPPSRVRYSAYYHLWTTVCLHDFPQLFGKAKRRNDSSDKLNSSVFEEYRRNDLGRFIAVEALAQLLRAVNARWVILSYSSGGRATAEQLDSILTNCGDILEVIRVNHRQNVMARMTWTNDWVREFNGSHQEMLFLIDKG